MSGQLESALVLAVKDTIKWESALDAPSQGTLTPVDPTLPFNALTYQQRDRELANRDIILGAAIIDTSVEISNVYNYPAIKPQLEGPVLKDLPFDADEITSAGTTSMVRHVKNSSIPWDASRYTDSDLYGRDSLVYEILARACQAAFINPPISRIDPDGSIFPDLTPWSLAEAETIKADINPALPLDRDLFKLPDQNLADRDNALATYVANLAQVLKNPFVHALRIYVKVDGPSTSYREPEIYVLTSDDGVNRIWQAEPALSDRNRIIYNVPNKTLQWIRESVDEVHVPQIYAMTIPGIDAGQLLTTLPQIPEKKDAQFWRLKAGLIVPAGEELTDTPAFLYFTATDAAIGGTTQIDSASLTAPGVLGLTIGGLLSQGNYRISVLAVPCPKVELAGAQNVSSTSGTLGGATFDVDVASGDITTKQYIVVSGDGIFYNNQGYAAGQVFHGVSGITTYTQAGAVNSSVRQYAVNFQLALTPGPWAAKIEYTDLSGLATGFGLKAQYVPNGASAVNVIQDIVPEPFSGTPGTLMETATAGFDVSNTGAFSFPVLWTYGTGQLHIRKIVFESNTATGHYQVRGQFGAGSLAYVDVIGTAFQPDVMRFEFNTVGDTSPLTLTANWVIDAQMPIKFKQLQIQTVGTYTPTPVSNEFAGWRQECLDRTERVVQQDYQTVISAYGTDLPTFRDSGSKWNPTATENWMSLVETVHPRLREVPDIDSTSGIIDGRQYQVVAGPISYGTNTYDVGQVFFGAAAVGTGYSGGNVKQVGAFIKSLPGHIGKPALIPYGLTYSGNGTVTSYYDTNKSIPVLVSCVPWMIDQGAYVAQSEFWVSDFLIVPQSVAEVVAPTVPPFSCGGNPSTIAGLVWADTGNAYGTPNDPSFIVGVPSLYYSAAGGNIIYDCEIHSLHNGSAQYYSSVDITAILCNPTANPLTLSVAFTGIVCTVPSDADSGYWGIVASAYSQIVVNGNTTIIQNANVNFGSGSGTPLASSPQLISLPPNSLTTIEFQAGVTMFGPYDSDSAISNGTLALSLI